LIWPGARLILETSTLLEIVTIMNALVGQLFVWAGDQAACVRVAGRANFALSVEFRKLLRHLQAGHGGRVLLDLSECQMMDSTFLGVLAFEAKQRRDANGGTNGAGLELLNANPTVRELIEDLGIGSLFTFVERDLLQAAFTAAPTAGQASAEELNRTCLEAHELLMALHPDNVAKFKEVAQFFAEELRSGGAGKA
jgi:anti-anti-sigma factor